MDRVDKGNMIHITKKYSCNWARVRVRDGVGGLGWVLGFEFGGLGVGLGVRGLELG